MLSISGSVTLGDILNFVNNMSFSVMTLALQQVTGALMTVFVLLCFLLAKCALVAPSFFFFFIERNQLVLTLTRATHDLIIYLGINVTTVQ
jgi:hypothetical protein